MGKLQILLGPWAQKLKGEADNWSFYKNKQRKRKGSRFMEAGGWRAQPASVVHDAGGPPGVSLLGSSLSGSGRDYHLIFLRAVGNASAVSMFILFL
jgi:hypothetical protein